MLRDLERAIKTADGQSQRMAPALHGSDGHARSPRPRVAATQAPASRHAMSAPIQAPSRLPPSRHRSGPPDELTTPGQ
jgi:hypothetical protein